jgi:hypothetical protein
MPYRDQATVDSWLREFLAETSDTTTAVSVLEKDFMAGPDSGLVVVSLRTASTMTYIQPVIRDGAPRWIVTFEARTESFDLDAAGVHRLADDIACVARITDFLQAKTDEVVARGRVSSAS